MGERAVGADRRSARRRATASMHRRAARRSSARCARRLGRRASIVGARARRTRPTPGRSRCPPRRARSCAPPTSNGGEPQPAPHEQRARALRAAELVRGDRAEVGVERGEVDRRRDRRPRTRRRARARRARAPPRATAAAGWIVPTSWFASCTITSAVSARTASSDLGGVEAADAVDADDGHARRRRGDTRRARTSARPRSSRRGRRPAARASAPQTAVLTASVPDDVNTTSRGRAPKNAATCSRASSSATRVTRPSACSRPGSAWCSRRNGSIASSAAGRSGDDDAWSRYARARVDAQTRVTQWSSPCGRLC